MTRRPRWGLVAAGAALVVLALALAALVLSDDGDPVADAAPSTPADRDGATTLVPTTRAATTFVPTTTVRRDARLGNGRPVTFAFGGDVHVEGAIRARLASDPAAVLAPVAPIFVDADVSMVNLETAITERGEPQPKAYTFRAPVAVVDALRLADVDVATLANNHGIDFGPVGLEDTLAARDATGFPMVGIGRDAAEAYAPWRTEVDGQRIAVFGASEVIDSAFRESWRATDAQPGLASAYPEALDRLVAAITAERGQADTIVVYLHYGREGETCPDERQFALVEALTAAGADLVVGSHTHRLQGAGRHGEAFVAYGLGNFVFSNETGPAGDSGVLTVTATGRRIDGYDWIPARIRAGVPTPLDGPAAVDADASWDALRPCTGLAP